MTSTVSKERFAIPASFAQERLWFLAQMNPGDPAYQIAGAVKFKGSLSIAALESSLDQIVQRHESLRTTFRLSDGSLMQVISPDGTIRLEVISVASSAGNHDDASVTDQLAALAQQSFDLETGPLVRFTLLRTAPDCHFLLLVIHHIIADGWSLMVLIREVMELYKASVRGVPAQLPALRIQYADYSQWQRKLLDNGRLQAGLEYWKTKLADLEATVLPADYARPVIQKHLGSSLSLPLSDSLTRDLVRLAQREQTTLFMVLLAAFKVLLHRHAGETEIVLGVPVAGRKRVEFEHLIGCFLNTVVLRTRVSHDDSFRELLKRVREVALEAYSYEDVPFETVLAALNAERRDNGSPLFHVFFNMINLPEALEIELPGLTAELIDLPESNSKFDLTLYVRHKREGIVLDLVYDVELFTQERMREVLSQFECLLTHIVTNPSAGISSFSLVTPEAMRLLPNLSEPLSAEWPGSVCDLFRSQVKREPERIAVADPHLTWTYNELDTISSKIGNHLLSLGLERQSVVAIYAHRSAPLLASLLGIMRAGFAFLILDPAYPPARLAEYVQLARARALIHLEGAGSLPDAVGNFFTEAGAPILTLPVSAKWNSEQPLRDASQHDPAVPVSSDDIAYIAFTSGSTGKPKGVPGGHRSLSHFAPLWIEKFGFRERDRFSMLSGLSHDPLHRDVFLALMAGATVCIPDGEDWKLAGHAIRWLQEARISVMNLTPAIGQLIKTGVAGSDTLESLRYIFFVGDSLTRHEVEEFRNLAPGVTCVNLYGATETQQALASYTVAAGHESGNVSESKTHMLQREIVPLGRGFKDVQLVLLNQTGQLCGVGELGEIYFRSPHLALGYLDDPKLTAERFVAWPNRSNETDRNNNKDSGRLYRTGDLGRYLPGGDVESAGRKDSQVKIRGFRVELAEIEAALKQHPWVHAAAVIALNESGNRYLAAYVVLQNKEQKWERELFRFVSDRLPSYMVPAAFVSLDALPMLPTGKIDRRALPAINPRGVDAEPDRAAHQEDEEIVAGIFAEALKRSHLGVHDNFFEAGGHSLLTIQVLFRVREIFGVELPHRAMFDEPTAAGLARRIRTERSTGAELPKIKKISRDRAIPLSFAQQRLWFLQQLQPESAAYNMLFGIRLNGRIDKRALQRSLNAIVQRHEILRTTFNDQGGIPVQNIQPEFELKIDEINLDHLSASAQEQEVERHRGLESQRTFDLQNGPLLRVKLICLTDEEHVLLMTMHHIAGDAWSTGVIIQELSEMYAAYVGGLPHSLPPLPVQYADFAAWQREWLQGDVLRTQVSYWSKQLSNMTTLELPLDRPRPALMSQEGAAIDVSLPPELTARLHHLARREGVTLFMTMLASWQLLLARYSGQEDIAIGAPVAGRTRSELGSLIGFFVNTLVLRTQVSRGLSVRELLQQVRSRCLEAFDYQDVPFEKIVEELQPDRDLSRQPFFQVMFGLQTAPQHELDLPGLKLTPLPQEQNLIAAKFDLTLLVAESGQGIQGRLEYVPDLFDRATVETLIRRWHLVLEQVAGNPELGLARISLMSDAERTEIVRGTSDFPLVHEPRHTFAALLSIHAQHHPAAIAVIEETRQLSYGELNRLANQWAHLLTQLGIQQGDRVIVRLERVTDVLQVALGILKCGAVMVGMDCSEPAARTQAIFELAGARAAITTQLIPEINAAASTRVFVFDELRKNISQEKHESPQVELCPNTPACILYHPDPQGRLRGVVLGQNAFCEPGPSVNALQTEGGAPERIALAFSFAHETTSLELFRAVSRGASVVSLPVQRPLPPRKLAGLLREQQVTTLYTSVSALERISREFPAALKGVQRVICEEAPAGLASRKEGFVPEIVERSSGGLASSGAGGLWLRYGISSMTAEGRVSGIELPTETRMCLLDLDQQMEPVPDGVLGEIYVSGPALALHYESRPADSAVDFLPDPFSRAPGSRIYRTGEQAWRRSDGSLQLRGRRDGRSTICGMQVATREIENAVLLHPDISEAAVVLTELDGKVNTVIAFVVPVAGRQVVAHELSQFLRLRVPEKMLPENIFQADEVPRSSDGQVDYAALRKLIDMRSGAAVDYVAPRNRIEEELASIWAKMFVKDRVGIHDNFFRLGGHSLLATQVIAHVNDVLHIELPLRRLFEAPTVAELAQVVEQLLASGSHDRTPRIAGVSRERPLPLSFAQQRLWFLDQLQPGSAAYNLRVAVSLSGELNREALVSSLQHIVRRHESLRTSFTTVEGAAVQIIAADLKLKIEEIDLQGRSHEEQEQEFNQHAHVEAVTPFDLISAPLARVKLVQFSKNEHALLVTMHHIIGDAWSLGILVREFGHLYEAYTLGETPVLPELALQYADYAVWQRAWLQGEVLERQVSYWRKQLAGVPALNLPRDHPRPAIMSQRGASVRLKVGPELTEALRMLSKSHGVTLFMTLLASFQLLLSRYSGQSDIAVGTPIAGRTRTETEGLIGFFINTLVLRATIREGASFRQLLDHVRDFTLEAYDHQDVPFEKLVDELQPERDLSRQPFFQVMFALQEATQDNMDLPGLRLSRIQSHEAQAAKFDLTMLLEESERGIEGHLEYTPDLFDQENIESFVERWQLIFEQVVKHEEIPLAYISLLREGERNLLCGWRGGERTGHFAPVGARIARHAQKTASATAVVAGGQELTWQKLHVRSNQWAHYLREQGVRTGTIVGVCLPSSVDLAVITIAVLKCGAVLAGFDADEPHSRLQQILRSSQAKIVIAQERLSKELEELGARLVLVDRLEKEIATESQSDVIEEAEADRPACILYRSSSLGYPVGILVPQHVLLDVEWLRDFECAELDRIGQEIGFSAELAALEWLRALAAGICVVDVASRPVLAPRRLGNLIREQKITFLWITAASLEKLGREFPAALKGVKEIFCRETTMRLAWLSQTLSKDLLDRVFAVEGSDEAGGSWRTHPLNGIAGGNSSAIRASDLRPGSALYLLDSQLEPVPEGVVGELYVGGGTLATGYHAEPQLTAQTFVPDPFSDMAGSRLYRTGELARRRGDGRVELCGRHDGRIMADGTRIHAEETEAVLRQHPAVHDAALVVQEGPDHEAMRMVAVVTKSHEELSIDEVIGFVHEKLSKVMRPHAIVELERIPRNCEGEIDRNVVAAILRQRDAAMAAPGYQAPRNDIERTLCAVWEEVLSVSSVGINDNFFKLGGDSILSIQVIARARQAGIGLLPRQIFEKQTIAELALAAGKVEETLAEQGTVTGEAPLAPFQREFFNWNLARPDYFNQSVLLGLNPGADSRLLEQAVLALLSQHDALRTSFERAAEHWRQTIQVTAPDGVYERVGLVSSHEPDAALEQEIARAQASLDLRTGRLMKAIEFDLGAERGKRLLLVIHHLVVDGVSWRILVDDLERGYNQLRAGQQIDLGFKTTSFKQWTEKLEAYAREDALQREVEYWSGLGRKKSGRLPVEFGEDREQNLFASQKTVTANLTEEETHALLQEVPGVYNTQINDVLLTALARVLGQWSGSDAVLIDLEGHGREEIFPDIDLSRTVGWFTVTYPVALEAGRGMAWHPGKALTRVKEQLRSVPNRGLGCGVLRHLSQDRRVRDRIRDIPVAEIIFNYLGQVDQVLKKSELLRPVAENSGVTIAPENRRAYILDVTGVVIQGRLQMNWNFSEQMHDRKTIEDIASRYMECLRELIHHCRSEEAGGYTPSDFPVAEMTQQELAQIASLLGE